MRGNEITVFGSQILIRRGLMNTTKANIGVMVRPVLSIRHMMVQSYTMPNPTIQKVHLKSTKDAIHAEPVKAGYSRFNYA